MRLGGHASRIVGTGAAAEDHIALDDGGGPGDQRRGAVVWAVPRTGAWTEEDAAPARSASWATSAPLWHGSAGVVAATAVSTAPSVSASIRSLNSKIDEAAKTAGASDERSAGRVIGPRPTKRGMTEPSDSERAGWEKRAARVLCRPSTKSGARLSRHMCPPHPASPHHTHIGAALQIVLQPTQPAATTQPQRAQSADDRRPPRSAPFPLCRLFVGVCPSLAFARELPFLDARGANYRRAERA